MRVVIAPDSLKGSASAASAAAAIARGWSGKRPSDTVLQLPMADGGEGTIDAIQAANPERATLIPLTVTGPDGRDVHTTWLKIVDPADGSVSAVVELARTSGITLLETLVPFGAHTYGFGQAISDALACRPDRMFLALGGSSSTDGGHGALVALGAHFTNADGDKVGLGNAALKEITHVDVRSLLRAHAETQVLVLSDVRSPLLGPRGAAAAFGPQKGVPPARITEADNNLRHFAAILRSKLRADPEHPGAGSAGGTGFGMIAWGADIVSGSETIATLTGLHNAVSSADLVITGEGRYDQESENGKVVGYLRELATHAGVPCALVAGVIDSQTRDDHQFAATLSLTDLAGDAAASMAEPHKWLEEAGLQLANGHPR